MNCNLPGSSVHGIIWARLLEYSSPGDLPSPSPSAGDLPASETEAGFPALQADSLPSDPPGKPTEL